MATPPMTITEEFAQKLFNYLSRCPYQEVYLLIQELQSAAQPPQQEVDKDVS